MSDSATPFSQADLRRSAFGPATLLVTEEGPLPLEWLVPGHKVLTRDHGFQEVIRTQVSPAAELSAEDGAPILVPIDALGEGEPVDHVVVAPSHLLLIRHPAADYYFSSREVYVAALDLLGINGIARAAADRVTHYHHFALARPCVIPVHGLGSAAAGPFGVHPEHMVLDSDEARLLRAALEREYLGMRQSA